MLHVPLQVSPSAIPTQDEIPLFPKELGPSFAVRTQSRVTYSATSEGFLSAVDAPQADAAEPDVQTRWWLLLSFQDNEFEQEFQDATVQDREDRREGVVVTLLATAVVCALALHWAVSVAAEQRRWVSSVSLLSVLGLSSLLGLGRLAPRQSIQHYDLAIFVSGLLWMLQVGVAIEYLWAAAKAWEWVPFTLEEASYALRASSLVAAVVLYARPSLSWSAAFACAAIPLYIYFSPIVLPDAAATTGHCAAGDPKLGALEPSKHVQKMMALPVFVLSALMIVYRRSTEHLARFHFAQVLAAGQRLRSERRHSRWLKERNREIESMQKALDTREEEEEAEAAEMRFRPRHISEATGLDPSTPSRSVKFLEPSPDLLVPQLSQMGVSCLTIPSNTATSSIQRLEQVLAGATTDWARVRHIAENIRHPGYSLASFFADCVHSFPEFRVFFASESRDANGFDSPTLCGSGRVAEVEYQRTVGAFFAVYWLLRLDHDGAEGFCFGMNHKWEPNETPEACSKTSHVRRNSQPPERLERGRLPLPSRQARPTRGCSIDAAMRKAKSADARDERGLNLVAQRRFSRAASSRSATVGALPSMTPERPGATLSTGALPKCYSGMADHSAITYDQLLSERSDEEGNACNPYTSNERYTSESSNRGRGRPMAASDQRALRAKRKPFSKMNNDEKRKNFYETMDWGMFADLVDEAGCLDGKDHVDRTVALLCLTAFHDIMKMDDFLPTVERSHAPYGGVPSGCKIHDHDVALSYILEHHPHLLPSYAGLPPELQKTILFTQCKMEFNHGWLVQAEAPPGKVLSGFKRIVAQGAHAKDIGMYFLHWVTDLAGAEGTPLGGAQKFTLKFPHAVFESFLHSVPFLTRLTHYNETEVFEQYLFRRWAEMAPDRKLAHHAMAIAQMRLALMAQLPDLRIVDCLASLPDEERAFMVEELSRTGVDGQRYSCCKLGSVPEPGGPALLIYYGPALLQRYAEGADPLELDLALRVLCEVMMAARQLFPLSDDEEDASSTVQITISALKACSPQELLVNPGGVRREVWLLVRKNDCEAIVELATPSRLNHLYDCESQFRLLDFGSQLFTEV